MVKWRLIFATRSQSPQHNVRRLQLYCTVQSTSNEEKYILSNKNYIIELNFGIDDNKNNINFSL